MTRIYLNGKFLRQRTTGVQRVASCLVQALDALPSVVPGEWVLLCPGGGDPPTPALRRIAVHRVGWAGLPLHLWEQLVLPLVAQDGLLVNLAGAAPFFSGRQTCLWHDAACFDHPEAYALAFVGWYRLQFRVLAARAAALFTVSAFSRARLSFHLRLDADRIVVLTPGSDHLQAVEPDVAILKRAGIESGTYLLAVASANPTKNLEALLAAWSLRSEGAAGRLVLVGGVNRSVFGGAAGTTAAAPQGVVRLGAVDDASLAALYRHALALVFPSRYEGFGLPPLEAMACGCPVAAAEAASIPEACGEAALYFDPASVESIASAIERLFTDPALRARLREAGLARAARYRWSTAAETLAAALRPLVAGDGAETAR